MIAKFRTMLGLASSSHSPISGRHLYGPLSALLSSASDPTPPGTPSWQRPDYQRCRIVGRRCPAIREILGPKTTAHPSAHRHRHRKSDRRSGPRNRRGSLRLESSPYGASEEARQLPTKSTIYCGRPNYSNGSGPPQTATTNNETGVRTEAVWSLVLFPVVSRDKSAGACAPPLGLVGPKGPGIRFHGRDDRRLDVLILRRYGGGQRQ